LAGLFVASLLKRIVLFLDIWSWLILIQSALTIFTHPGDQESRAVKLLTRITEPINGPFRRLLKKTGVLGMPVDMSPMLSLITLWVLSRLLNLLSESVGGF
jgi:uncharacterized protein YggT (Ycf19 family)